MLTDATLRAQLKGKSGRISDGGKGRDEGRLIAEGGSFYFRYFLKREDGTSASKLLKLGTFPHMSIKDARAEAGKQTELLRAGVRDLHAHRANTFAKVDAATQATRAEIKRNEAQTLRALLTSYANSLTHPGTRNDTLSLFNKRVFRVTEPALADRHAATIKTAEFVALLRLPIKEGYGTTANKLRSCMSSAYQQAISSKFSMTAPAAVSAFDIESNPLRNIPEAREFKKADTRYLEQPELRALVRRLYAAPQDVKRDAAELGLLLGGQRTAQLVRLRRADVKMSERTITLYDDKGARLTPYAHMLPLTTRAAAVVQRRLDATPEECEFLFSENGRTKISPETVAKFVGEIARAMVEAKESQPFTQKHVRKSGETLLAARAVHSDVLGMLQSHGQSGVQKKSYNFYKYRKEVLSALVKWEGILGLGEVRKARKSAEVVPMRKAA